MVKFKKDILEKVFDNFEKFYIHIMPHKNLIIGNRGLIDQEKEKGLMLVFGPYSYKDFDWDDENIYVSMRFSGVWEFLTIPFDSIVSIFDDPLNPNFVISFRYMPEKEDVDKEKPKVEKTKENEKVIKLNFSRKNKE
ncbi:ClpXP protease specificity-enhancing factor SspB [Deferribacter thermophilus]|uniref:ClpXP protease specificity-enhancing factor SspB n=1 Tax=Deferribacter thermophilus TaxID=53573 RepID=UPI003C14D500